MLTRFERQRALIENSLDYERLDAIAGLRECADDPAAAEYLNELTEQVVAGHGGSDALALPFAIAPYIASYPDALCDLERLVTKTPHPLLQRVMYRSIIAIRQIASTLPAAARSRVAGFLDSISRHAELQCIQDVKNARKVRDSLVNLVESANTAINNAQP